MWKYFLLLLLLLELPDYLEAPSQDIAKELQKWREQIVKISQEPPNNRTQQLNKYMDTCMQALCATLNGSNLDPLMLPKYNSTLINNTVYGIIELSNSKLRGLSTIARHEYVIVKFGYPLIKIHVPLQFNKISFEANYYAQLIGLSTESLLVAELNSFAFSFDWIINVRTVSILREQFKITTLGKLTLSLGGRISGMIVDVLLGIIKPALEPMIRNIICQNINNVLDNIVDFIGLADENNENIKNRENAENGTVISGKDIVSSIRSGNVTKQVEVASRFLDEKVERIQRYMKAISLDPFRIRPKNDPNARVKLSNGVLLGLASLTRADKVSIKYKRPTMRIGIPVGFKNLSFSFDYQLATMGTVSTGSLTGNVRGCVFQLDVQLNTVFVRLKLDNFRILSLGKVSVWMGGSVVGYTASIIVKTLQPIWEPLLYLSVEQTLLDKLQESLSTFNDIACTFLNNCHIKVKDVYEIEI